jgi:hypothetical protein
MTDISRIEKRFYLHPKARRAREMEPGSISLWLFANCFCRDHRAQGFMTREQALELGSEAEIKALVVSGLWREVAGGYEFNDWLDWNPDLIRKGVRSSAAQIVWDVLSDHPTDARMRLAREVEKLIDEGVSKHVIEAALRKWGDRPDARVSWLPYFVSDAIREGETGVHGAIKHARETGNMTLLAEYGYRWSAPDLPPRISLSRAREFISQKKQEFLNDVEAGLRSDAAAQ